MSFRPLCAFLLVLAAPASAQHTPHYTYEGEHGPEAWGHMSEEWATCATGAHQSPVEIVSASAVTAPALTLSAAEYRPAPAVVRNLGHTIQIEPQGDAGGVTANGVAYSFRQVHFHHLSEHRIDGQSAAMEAHFVHQSAQGDYLVFGILIHEAGAAGAPGSLAKFLDVAMRLAPAHEEQSHPVGSLPPLAQWIGGETGFFTYAGSLTTPPCSQSVTWVVARDPQYVLADDIAQFVGLVGENARPVQPLNDRVIHSQ